MNNYFNKGSFIGLIVTASILGCNKKNIEKPVIDLPDVIEKPTKKVFLEIFTGYRCVNCPKQINSGVGSLVAANLEGKTVTMYVHQSIFARPAGNKFKVDFQTNIGDSLSKKYSVMGLPSALVDRKIQNDTFAQSVQKWATIISQSALKSDVYLKISKVYDASNRNIKISISSSLYENTINKLNASAYIVEDSISYWQVDDGVVIPNFIHRHVLRDAFSSANGNDLFAANATKGIKASKEFTPYTLKPEWNDKHCEIIVIITDAVTGEVLQVEEAKVTE